jgi:putative ABC transport system ATP-binding protein
MITPVNKNGPANGHLIELRQASKTYATPAGPFTALKGVDLTISRGEFVAVIGKSGSGKSTLLNVLSGIDRPSGGEVYVAGAAVHTLTENQIATWRGRNVGVVFQFFQLLPTLTILENVILPMDFSQAIPLREREPRARQLL